VAANQEIKGPAPGATYLKGARRDGEALVRDRIQLRVRAEESWIRLKYTGADVQLGRRRAAFLAVLLVENHSSKGVRA
jgi:hypothetical protein